MKRVRLRIHGRVQGVWYRGWSVERARELGLDGWVRNRADGTVEMSLSGPQAAIDAMLDNCRHGPRAAQVSRIDAVDESEAVEPGFRQLLTL
jgi:acylphosphatase